MSTRFNRIESYFCRKINQSKLEIIYLMIGVSAFIALIFLGIYIWAVRDGQFDDTYTPAVRMLFDDIEVYNESHKKSNKKNTSSTIKNK